MFVTGPTQILAGTYLRTDWLRWFMIITGVANILYNGHNFFCLEYGSYCSPVVNYFNAPGIGKHQIHRIYNLIIMYPIFYMVSENTDLPEWLRGIMKIQIVIGVSFNLYNYFKHVDDLGFL